MLKINDTVEIRIQNPIPPAIGSIFVPETEKGIRSINGSSRRDATSVMETSEREEHIRISAPFQSLSEKNNTCLTQMIRLEITLRTR